MFGNKDTKQITFFYEKDSLFDNIGEISANMVKSIAEQSSSVFDAFVISDDERELVDSCLEKAAKSVYDKLLNISPSSESTSSFDYDVEITVEESEGLEREVGSYIELTVIDNKAYNYNVRQLVDESITQCLVYGTLSSFYSINANATLQKLSQDEFINNMLLLEQRLFQLKKKPMMSLL